MILYWAGVLIALCINLAITCSLASLLEIGVLIVATLIYILANADTIVIWRNTQSVTTTMVI